MKLRTTSAAAFAALVLNGSLSAATIANVSRTSLNSGTTAFDLTSIGSSDWAIWKTADNPASGTPTHQKSGASLISTATAIGTGNLRGSSSGTEADFSWTDGSPTAVGSLGNASGIFSSVLDTEGEGIGLTITLPTTDTYRISIWTSIYLATGTFTASLPGATTYVDEVYKGANNPKFSFLYSFDVTPDNANDILSISHVLTTEDASSGSSHVLLSGAAIGVVPEPSSALLLGIAGMALLLRRRAH